MLDQSKLKELISYNPDTGVFVWRKRGIKYWDSRFANKKIGSKDNNGYLCTAIQGKRVLLHRAAWLYVYGYMPKRIDHINGVTSDNRITNLREVTHKQNMKNQATPKNNSSGHIGITWNKNASKWKATIMHEGKNIHLGYYSEIEIAIKARVKAAKRYGYHNNHGRSNLTTV